MRRALLFCAAIVFAIACGDNITESVPDRSAVTPASPPVSFATTTTEDGLSISTDKDDYQPGDTVHFTGSGWPADDVLNIRLDDEPATHPPHTWTVSVNGDGTFQDSTYVVDVGDLGVTFTLTATTTLADPQRTLSVQFTDNLGNIRMAATPLPTSPFSPNQASSAGIKDLTTFTLQNGTGEAAGVTIKIRAGEPSGTPASQTLVRTLGPITVAGNATASLGWDGKDDGGVNYVADGVYTARIFGNNENNGDNDKRRIVVDNSNPSVAVDAISGGTKNVEQTITGTAADFPAVAGAGLEKVEVAIRRASDDAILASGNATNTGTNFSTWSFTYTPTEANAQKATAKATDNAGNNTTSAVQNFTVTTADEQAPTINCTVPDQSIWYGNNVTVNCTASDEGSGLKNSSDANFSLSTSVSSGTETNAAQTNSRQVCDNDDNCATAGPYTFMVDRKAPTFSCGAADGLWHNDNVAITCTAADGGSGLAPASDANFSLSTTVPAGTETSTASTGTKTLTDAVGNTATAGPISGNMVDRKAPTFSCGSADGNWHASDVSINCTAADGGSGLNPTTDAAFTLSTSVDAGTETSNASTGTKTLTDAVGNTATAGPISGNKVDKKGPVVVLTCPASPLILNATVTANWSATDGGSGLAGPASGTITVPTNSVGSASVAVPINATKDAVNNQSPASNSCNYSVIYDWSGFFQPVDNLELNVARAGSAIPVKFNLGGNQGLDIFFQPSQPPAYPNSSKVACNTYQDQDTIEETVNAGQSSLTYDAVAQQYVYVWKSDKAWAGTCRRLDVKLKDGTTHSAVFKWMK